jgi:hypothetical protein
MNQEISALIATNQNKSIYSNGSLSPWSRQPQIVSPPPRLHLNPAQDQLPKNIHDQVQLVKAIQQLLVTEQQKLEWMMNNLQASTQGFQQGQHRMKHILLNQGQTSAEQNEDPNHICIEDLVVEEINKRRTNGPIRSAV